MSLFNKHSFLYTLIIPILFITQQNSPINLEPYQSYIITCVTSCCMGIMLCILFQKYCCNKPTTIIKENLPNKKKKKEFLEQLSSKVNTLQKTIEDTKREQNKLIELLQNQGKNINYYLFIPSSLYWYQQCKEKVKECESYKQQLQKKEISTLQLTTPKSTSSNNKKLISQ